MRARPAAGRLVALACLAAAATAVQAREAVGSRTALEFDHAHGPAITAWLNVPPGLAPDTPVVFVMHGVRRNGEEYRDQWASLSDRHGFLLVVPEFSVADFPGAERYNLGGVFDRQGRATPPAQWAYSYVEPLFDAVRARFGLETPGYALYGHSAGAQFAHRFALHVPGSRAHTIVSANAGWYQMPSMETPYPYGMAGAVVGEAELRRMLRRRVVVLLGDADTDPAHRSLRTTPDAMAQGAHRYARGRAFFAAAEAAARRLGVDFGWELAVAPGVAHDNAGMAPHAVPYLLPAERRPVACDFGSVRFLADFDGGRLGGCRRLEPGRFELRVLPEDEPVNPSPWYAFAIETGAPMALELTLVYEDVRHRYDPQLLGAGDDWRPVGGVQQHAEGTRAVFTIEVAAGRTIVAARALMPATAVTDWLSRVAQGRRDLQVFEFGRSEQGRPLVGLRTVDPRREVVVLAGRQHPPEMTGAIGLEAFVERLLADDPLARRFRRDFALLAMPLVNPDGVALGQWRHNASGVDLNRDWGAFTQAETRAARAALEAAAGQAPGRLALFLDFHSTRRNVFYTQPEPVSGGRPGFTRDWIAGIEAIIGRAPPRVARIDGRGGTAKSWVHTTYDAPAITFEFGDDTDPADARRLAAAAAESAMRALLAR